MWNNSIEGATGTQGIRNTCVGALMDRQTLRWLICVDSNVHLHISSNITGTTAGNPALRKCCSVLCQCLECLLQVILRFILRLDPHTISNS